MRRPSIALSLVALATCSGEEKQVTPVPGPVTAPLLLDLATKVPAPPTVVEEDWSPVWMPDSRRALVSVRSDLDRRTSARDIRLVDVLDGTTRTVAKGVAPTPSPDGRYVAFVGDGDDVVVLELGSGTERTMQVGGGETPYIPLNGRGIVWSPDSRRLIVARVDGGLRALSFGVRTRLMRADARTGRAEQVLQVRGAVAHLNWSPNGRDLYYAAQGLSDEALPGSPDWPSLYRLDLNTGRATKIAAPLPAAAMLAGPTLSPDGRYLAFNADHVQQNVTYATVPTVLDLSTDRVVTELKGLRCHRWLPTFFWTPDSGRLSFACKAGSALMHSIMSAGRDGTVSRVDLSALQDVASWSLSPDGRRMIWRGADPSGRLFVRTALADGSDERTVVDMTPPAVRALSLGRVREVRWTAPDGLEIAGLLVQPINYQAGRKYPLIVDLHGGPQGGISLVGALLTATPLEWHFWAAQGWAVFIPDYRSSLVYGFEPFDEMRREGSNEETAFLDIVAGVDSIVRTGMVDAERMAVIGHSEGGTKANWLLTRTERFKAVITKGGGIDYRRDYETIRDSPLGVRNVEWLFGGASARLSETLAKNSAIERAGAIRTPVFLVTAGDADRASVEPLIDRLKGSGLLTHLHFDDENHAVEKPKNLRTLLERSLGFLRTQLRADTLAAQPSR